MAIRSLKTGAIGRSALAGNPVILPGAYESIASFAGNGSSSNFTFSSIPSTYSHLQIRLIVRGVRAYPSEQLYIRLNGDSTSGAYRYHYVYGDGGGVSAGASGADTVFLVNELPAANETANIYSSSVIDLLDYASTNKYKTMRSLSAYDNNGNTGSYNGKAWFGSGIWLNAAAVTSLSVLSNGAFASNTSIALYGVN
jgi:hypothetical protein